MNARALDRISRANARRFSRRRPPTTAELEQQCRDWNARYPVGTFVEFYPVAGEPDYRTRKTRSEAYVLSGHTAVIFLENESGCVALDHCAAVPSENQPRPEFERHTCYICGAALASEPSSKEAHYRCASQASKEG